MRKARLRLPWSQFVVELRDPPCRMQSKPGTETERGMMLTCKCAAPASISVDCSSRHLGYVHQHLYNSTGRLHLS
jgi:hypothetical protein